MKKESENYDLRVVVFACNWCSYAGADTAGVGRMQYPPNVRLIRVMGSGRRCRTNMATISDEQSFACSELCKVDSVDRSSVIKEDNLV